MLRLDYGNATLAGLPAFQRRRLQSVLNAAARLIHRSPRYEHITPLLQDLHWLRSPKHINFKLAVLVYRCLHVSLLTTYLITSNMLPIPTVDDFVHRHHRCY